MTADVRIRDLVVIGSAVVAGLAGTAVALGSRGGDAQFLQDQRHPPDLRPGDVERVVRSAPDPLVGSGEGDSAICKRGGSSALGNPWSCVVRYPSGRAARLTVRVSDDGTYTGRYAGGGGAQGCCIDLPGAQ
jgi:hypothetical protein